MNTIIFERTPDSVFRFITLKRMFVKAINKNHILRPYYLLNLKL